MHLIAKVFDLDITEEEVKGERQKAALEDSPLAQIHALNRLIDRCLLFHEALVSGYSATDDEFDCALLETLEEMDTVPRSEEQTRRMEQQIRKRIIIRKYVQQICSLDIPIDDEQLLGFYEDQKDVFLAPETVRASHILIRGDEPQARETAHQLRGKIHSIQDFTLVCPDYSQCPSVVRCGDLGWFPRGKMIKEIEDVAFSLKPGEISDVFKSAHGYHILILTDKKAEHIVPFEDIRESLKARLIQLEREYLLDRHLNDLRKNYRDQIKILDKSYTN